MYMIAEVSQYVAVASFAEAWIEITTFPRYTPIYATSPPSRRRGLKSNWRKMRLILVVVASFAEAWIEISSYLSYSL